MEELAQKINNIGQQARSQTQTLASLTSSTKNAVLQSLAEILDANRNNVIAANEKDIAYAKDKGLSSAMIDRLVLDNERIDGIINGIKQVASLADPVGNIDNIRQVESGLKIGKMRTPIGVIGMIYESRPNVTIDAAILCFKSGNAVILRGGSEAYHSNVALIGCIHQALEQHDLAKECIQYIDTTDRDAVGLMVKAKDYIDAIIPRGSKTLIERIDSEAKVPVIKHLDGNCHVYIDSFADTKKAVDIAFNAKTRRYGICGSMETLLVHIDVAESVLPELNQRYKEKGVELRACDNALNYVDGKKASDDDFYTEFLGPILAVKIVNSIDEAIAHINHYGSHHTDSIVTENISHSNIFLQQVDSSSVMINASTQFADGFEYGLGAEIGISTNKLHVRGPVGLEGLTTQKYVVFGDGHTRN